MLMVPEDEWCLGTLLVKDRRIRLLNPPWSTQLLESLVAAAVRSALDGLVQLHWVPACNMPGFCRIEAVIPLPEDVFDYLFNGRSGYRAQYYLSPAMGEQYNRSIIEGVEKPVSMAFMKASNLPVVLDVAIESLCGRYSKIWVSGDWATFLHEPNILLAKRWTEYWSTTQDESLGLKAPLPPSPAIDLKGTFIRPETRQDWLDPRKADRSGQIYRTGWT